VTDDGPQEREKHRHEHDKPECPPCEHGGNATRFAAACRHPGGGRPGSRDPFNPIPQPSSLTSRRNRIGTRGVGGEC
jgi:hypothetical protein